VEGSADERGKRPKEVPQTGGALPARPTRKGGRGEKKRGKRDTERGARLEEKR